MVSVIIPNFNRSKYLTQAIRSVMDQTFQEWELLVVDDGSTDDSESIVLLLGSKDDRIKWLPRKENLTGAPVCRNIGISQAKSDFIVFLDSDDLLAPNCLEQRMLVMENSSFDFAVFPMLLFKQDPEDAKYLWNVETEEDDADRFLRLDAVWQTTGPIWRKQFLINLGGFDERLNCWQDVDLHIRALLAKPTYKKFYKFPPDCFYRKNSISSISQQEINSPKKMESRFLLIRKLETLIIPKYRIKFICVNMLISSLNSRNIQFFFKGYIWSIKKTIFKSRDQIMLFQLAIITFLRFDRSKFFNTRKHILEQRLFPESQIGKINYETTN